MLVLEVGEDVGVKCRGGIKFGMRVSYKNYYSFDFVYLYYSLREKIFSVMYYLWLEDIF